MMRALFPLAAAWMLAACATNDAGQAGVTVPVTTTADAETAQRRAAAAELEPVAAATFWSQEWRRDQTDYEAGLNFARALRRIGSASQAATVAETALANRPGDVELILVLAAARVEEGRAPAAIAALEQAVTAAPSDWRPYSMLGVALDHGQQPLAARARYQQALSVSPDNPAVLTNLGMSYFMSGDPDQAEETLRRAAALAGAGPEARQNLAMVLAYQGRFDEAEQVALIDLPPAAVQNNLDYARAMLSRPRRWEDLRR